MNTTRRNFLKGMAGVLGIAAVGVKPGQAQAVDESIWLDAIPDSVLDMPVTEQEPLAWLKLDGHRYELLDLSFEFESYSDVFSGVRFSRGTHAVKGYIIIATLPARYYREMQTQMTTVTPVPMRLQMHDAPIVLRGEVIMKEICYDPSVTESRLTVKLVSHGDAKFVAA